MRSSNSNSAGPGDDALPAAPATPGQLFWRRLRQRRVAMFGAWVLVVLYGMALLAGFVAPYSFSRQDRQRFFHPPTGLKFRNGWLAVARTEAEAGKFVYRAVGEETKPVRLFARGESYQLLGFIPARIHLFGTGDDNFPVYLLGTDQYGRDILSRVLYGSQISLSIGLVGIVLSFSIGMMVGGLSGYFGGRADNVIMRACEMIMSIPGLYLIMALRATFPPKVSATEAYFLIVAIMSFVGWASAARVVRGMTLSLRERQYVLAARALGQSTLKIVARHILPGTFSYVVVAATLSVPYYILGEVALSFLNVGVQEPDASWGNMLSAAQQTEYLTNYPWLLAPGAAIFLTVLAFNFLGDGLRDALDTKS